MTIIAMHVLRIRRRLCPVHCLLVRKRFMYYSVQSEMSAVWKLESPLVRSFLSNNIGKNLCMELCPL